MSRAMPRCDPPVLAFSEYLPDRSPLRKVRKLVPSGCLDIRFFFAIISAMDERAQAILIAAAVIVAPKLRDFKDTPALRSAVHDAIRVAEYMARVVERRCAEKKPA